MRNLANSGAVICGPSGLSHPEWEKTLRPGPASKSGHSLDLLAQHFGVVEVSSTFEEPIRPEVAQVWVRKTEAFPDFRFTVKLHRKFTHDRVLGAAEVKSFSDALAPLTRAGKLGCLLLQFPWSFRYTAENRSHLIALRRAFHQFQLVAEMRHSSWMLDEAIGTFIDYHVGFCNIDQPRYTKSMPATSFLTSPIGYVRLHGRNCFNWYGAADHASRAPRYDYLYSEEELKEWVARIDRIRSYAKQTFVVANNGSNGKAIVNALELQALLHDRIPMISKEMPLSCRRGVASQTAMFTEFHSKAVA